MSGATYDSKKARLKGKVYERVVKPSMMCGLKTVALTINTEGRAYRWWRW